MTHVFRGFAIAVLIVLAGCQQSSTSSTPSSTTAASEQVGAAPSASPASTEATAAGGAMTTTPSGLKIEELVVGTGATAEKGKTVSVHYTGWLIDKSKADHFDSSLDRGQPFEFALGQGAVIRGWDEGVDGMKVGGKRRLTIPPSLGYGSQGAGGVIPPNATLVFEVELLGVR